MWQSIHGAVLNEMMWESALSNLGMVVSVVVCHGETGGSSPTGDVLVVELCT